MFVHIDVKSCYAECERLFHPKLRGRPIVVLSNNDGCVISRSTEAKDLGIEMGGPYFQIKDLLKRHNVAVFSSNYALYGDISERFMKTLSQFSPDMEVYSIDEAFLELSGDKDYSLLATTIKNTVRQWVGIPVRVGVAPTKTLAKLANHTAKKKPEEVCVLDAPSTWLPVLADCEVKNIWGIGRQYSKMLQEHGVDTALKFAQLPDTWLRKHMSVVGLRTAQELRGTPCIELEPEADPKKGVTVSRCFGRRITAYCELHEAMSTYASRAGEKLRRENLQAKHILVFMHTSPHATDKVNDPYYAPQMSFAMPHHTNYTPELVHYATWALKRMYKSGYRYMKCGVIFTDLVEAGKHTLDLFDTRDTGRQGDLMKAIDSINAKMGRRTVFLAATGAKQEWVGASTHRSRNFTTDLNNLMRVRADL